MTFVLQATGSADRSQLWRLSACSLFPQLHPSNACLCSAQEKGDKQQVHAKVWADLGLTQAIIGTQKAFADQGLVAKPWATEAMCAQQRTGLETLSAEVLWAPLLHGMSPCTGRMGRACTDDKDKQEPGKPSLFVTP
eukprot:1156568-Pelagomonas_calceolata.AAC.1